MGPVTGMKKTEFHVLSRESDFKEFIEHKGTALHYTDPETRPWAWDFGIGSGNDLICIGRGPSTGSGMTEVHKLSCSAKYKRFSLHIATRLNLTCTKVRTDEPGISVPDGCKVPEYWVNKDLSLGFDERVNCDESSITKLQELLDETFKQKSTRDRTAKMPNRLKIRMCHRIEDARMWIRYFEAKQDLEGRSEIGRLEDEFPDNPVKTSKWAENSFEGSLSDPINEFLLMHGTSPQGIIGISNDGFRRSLTGTNAGSMFTAGCYLAESCTKADEYAKTDDTFYEGLCGLLLCRTACGKYFRVQKPDDATITALVAAEEIDSVLGDREAAVGTYREFVVFNERLIYPEYVLLYERLYDESEVNGYECGNLGQQLREAVERATEGDEGRIMEVFRKFDADGNGTISKQELMAFMSEICSEWSEENVDTLVSQVDRNGDGVIDFEEFLAFLGF
jgi:hypothetical protein